AAHQELDDKAHRAILTGDVVITQAEMTLRAARVNVAFSGSALNGTPEATRVDAVGGVIVTRPDQRARSDYAIYDVKGRTITMLGNVDLIQNGNN
ncbi:LptA/OstA family protein, partial [Acinetobacter baumannii]